MLPATAQGIIALLCQPGMQSAWRSERRPTSTFHAGFAVGRGDGYDLIAKLPRTWQVVPEWGDWPYLIGWRHERTAQSSPTAKATSPSKSPTTIAPTSTSSNARHAILPKTRMIAHDYSVPARLAVPQARTRPATAALTQRTQASAGGPSSRVEKPWDKRER